MTTRDAEFVVLYERLKKLHSPFAVRSFAKVIETEAKAMCQDEAQDWDAISLEQRAAYVEAARVKGEQ